MTLSPADAIALASLVTGWLGSLALVWWILASMNRKTASALAEHRVDIERRLGEKASIEHLDLRFTRLEDRLTAELSELRSALMPSSRR